jgi:CHAT domain-containing protein
MKYLFLFLLLLPIYIFGQNEDCIIKNSGKKVLGELKKINLSKDNGFILFKSETSSKYEKYRPKNIYGFKINGEEFHSKQLPINKRKSIPVFMKLISGDKEASVIVYEYDNNYERDNKTKLFLDRRSLLTEVQFRRFKKQMKDYFRDKENVLEMIENGGIKKEDLLAIVVEYNDVFNEEIAIFHENQNNSNYLEETTPQNNEETKSQIKIWDFNDIVLSSEDAKNKILSNLEEELKRIREEDEQNIVTNSKLGFSFFEQTQYDRALPFLIKTYNNLKTSSNSAHDELRPEVMSTIGAIYLSNKDYDNAAYYNSQALEIWKGNSVNKKDIALVYQSYLNQASIFKNLAIKNESNHKQWYEKIVSSTEQDWLSQMNKLGLNPITHATYPEKSENYNLAFLCLTKAATLISEMPKKMQVHKKISLELQLGALHFGAGEYPLAKTHYDNGLNGMLQNYDRRHPILAETQRIIGEIYLAERLYTEALDFVDKAQFVSLNKELKIDDFLLNNISQIPFPFQLLNAITTKAIILYDQNKSNPTEAKLKKVLAYYAISTALLHELRKTHRREGSKHNLSEATHRFSQHAIITCNALYNLTSNDIYLNEAYSYAELSKSAVLFETIHDLKTTIVSGIPREEIVKENGLKVQIAYLKSKVFHELQQGEKQNKKRLHRIESKITDITKEHNKLIKSFEKKYPKYYALKYNYQGADVKDLQQELNENEVFLEYIATDSFIYVLAIGKNKIKSHWAKLELPLSNLSRILQHSIKDKQLASYYKYGLKLYHAVIGDLAPFIKNKKLIISPDAQLHYIPFGVLPTPKSKIVSKGNKAYREIHYMIEDYPICYNYSASMYSLSKQPRAHHSTKSIATWAPNFNYASKTLKKKGLKKLAPLPGAQKEAQVIANMFNGNAFIEYESTEAKFKAVADQYSVLHIATHGILNDLNPIYSSLVMSKEDGEDGFLHAFELYNMTLNADLAVLSACNSGMGHLTKEEGIISIARGFSYAGVPNIIMSKWPVSDWATTYLMTEFYKNIKTGMPKDVALQQAKVQFLKEHRGSADILAPFYWGGFVLSGNSDPIHSLVSAPFYYWVIGGLIAILLLLVGYRRFVLS